MRGFVAALQVLLLVGLGIAAGACGDAGDELTLQEYSGQLQVLVDEERERSEPAEAAFNEDLGSSTSVAEQVEASQTFFAFALSDIQRFVESLQDFDPPAEVEDLHREIVDGYEDVITSTDALLNQLGAVESEAELTALFSDYVSNFEPLSTPCRQLEGIAGGAGIEVNLDCETVDND